MEDTKTICFVTRCHPKRPKLRQVCIDSIKAQTCNDYSHLLFRDDTTEDGYGRDKADLRLREAAPLDGKYIMVLDDDDRLINIKFVAKFKEAVAKTNPDVVMFKGWIGPLGIMPYKGHWGKPPGKGVIGSFCFAVTREFWDKYIHFWKGGVGDWRFIDKCYKSTKNVLWLDELVSATQRISAGRGE